MAIFVQNRKKKKRIKHVYIVTRRSCKVRVLSKYTLKFSHLDQSEEFVREYLLHFNIGIANSGILTDNSL